jgi:hypothetical protein
VMACDVVDLPDGVADDKWWIQAGLFKHDELYQEEIWKYRQSKVREGVSAGKLEVGVEACNSKGPVVKNLRGGCHSKR